MNVEEHVQAPVLIALPNLSLSLNSEAFRGHLGPEQRKGSWFCQAVYIRHMFFSERFFQVFLRAQSACLAD